jgi:chemotaxis response regulator CheB
VGDGCYRIINGWTSSSPACAFSTAARFARCGFTRSTHPTLHNVRPAADKTFDSAADVFRQKCIGVVMPGMDSDGAIGSLTVKELGGRTMVQSPETRVIPSTPESALKLNAVQESVLLEPLPKGITEAINEVVQANQSKSVKETMAR